LPFLPLVVALPPDLRVAAAEADPGAGYEQTKVPPRDARAFSDISGAGGVAQSLKVPLHCASPQPPVIDRPQSSRQLSAKKSLLRR